VRLVGEYSKILDKLPSGSKQHRPKGNAGHDHTVPKDGAPADVAPAVKK
jgi:hypothetical protein